MNLNQVHNAGALSTSRLPSGRDQAKRFVIGVDYGTTFTSVAYIVRPPTYDGLHPGDVKTIKNWPYDNANSAAEQVPSESWYPASPIERPAIEDQFDTPNEINSQRHREGTSLPWSVGKGEAIFDEEDIEAAGVDSDESKEFLWGYSVSYQRYNAHTIRNPMRRIEHAKLMLVKTPYTNNERTELRRKLNHLINRRIIRKYGKRSEPDVRDVRDVITDFLIKVFQHTKQQLIIHEDYSDCCPVEWVITVPTIWSSEASRVLQFAVEAAIDATGLGRLKDGSVDNLFIIPVSVEGDIIFLLGTVS